MNHRTAYAAGAAAPLLFLCGVAVASRAEESYMDGFNWGTWPAGLALGPHGWLWASSAITLGVLLGCFAAFATRLSRVGGTLLALAALGALMFSFDTDIVGTGKGAHTGAPFSGNNLTQHVHGIGFVLFVPAVLIGAIVLWRAVRTLPGWQTTRAWAASALLLVIPGLALPSSHPVGGFTVQVIALTPLFITAARLAALDPDS